MRLLKKSDIDAKKAQERSIEMSEGKKLAKAVDDLRELRVNEEAGLETWRVESVKRIQGEISELQNTLDTLKSEVPDLEARKRRAQEPLTAAWKDVDDMKDLLQKEKDALHDERLMLQQGISLNIQRERLNTSEAGRIKPELHLATQSRVNAEENERETQRLLRDTREKSSIISAALDLREKEVDERACVLTERETNLEEREGVLATKSIQLDIRENELRARWKVLLQTEREHG